jgi:hypothetical protein
MLKQWPKLDNPCSTRYHVQAHVHTVIFYFIQSARDNTAKHYELHHFESAAESLQSIDYHLANNRYLFPIAERVEGGACGPNPMQREWQAGNQWLA